MTTEHSRHRTSPILSSVRGPLGSTLVAGGLAVTTGALVTGSPAAAGAGIGVAMVSLFFMVGAGVLSTVTRLAPAAALLVALMTYTVKVVLVGLVFVLLRGSGALDGPVDAQWLGGTVIACTLVWTTTQIVVGSRARQPVYDLPDGREEAIVR